MFTRKSGFIRSARLPGRGRRVLPQVAFIVLLIMLWPYAVSIGDNGVGVSVINNTRNFLHVTINGVHFLYVSPGGVVSQQTDSFSTVVMEVAYSPGQDVTGKGSKTVEPVRTDVVSTSNTCTESRGSDCQSTTSANSSVSPVSWNVIPADLTAN